MDQFLEKGSLASLNTKLFLLVQELLKLLVAGRLEDTVGKLHLSACLLGFSPKYLPLAMPRSGFQAKWIFQSSEIFPNVFLALSHREDLLFSSIYAGTKMKIKIKCKLTS